MKIEIRTHHDAHELLERAARALGTGAVVEVVLPDGAKVMGHPVLGDWMGGTTQRPYPRIRLDGDLTVDEVGLDVLRHRVDCATTTAMAHIEQGCPPESYGHVLAALNLIRDQSGLERRDVEPLDAQKVEAVAAAIFHADPAIPADRDWNSFHEDVHGNYLRMARAALQVAK